MCLRAFVKILKRLCSQNLTTSLHVLPHGLGSPSPRGGLQMDLNNSLNSSMRKIAPAHSAGAICPSHLSRASLAQSQATFPRSELCLIGKIAWNQTYRKLKNNKLDIGVYPDTMYPIPRYLGPISEYTPIPCSLGINLGFLVFEDSVFKCLWIFKILLTSQIC